jgi:ketosteroid isomerase-like protein
MNKEAEMAGSDALSVVQRMYDCFNKGDMDTIRREIFAKDLVWRLPGHNPLAGVKHGADEVLAFFGQLRKANIQVDLIGLYPWGEDTVVETHRGHGESQGYKLDALNCTHYKISAGQIYDVQVFMSDQHAADTFFNAIYQLKPIPDRLADA